MVLALRISVILLCILFGAYVFRQIAKDKMQLKYSLLWLLLGVLALLSAIWPEPLFALSRVLGFQTPANFIFLIGMILILAILLSLSLVVSWQSRYIRALVQELALLKDALGMNDPE